MRWTFAALAVGMSVGGTWTGNAWAQDLPCTQVRLIVPYPAGGATDVASRVVA